MRKRTQARQIAMQALYQYDLQKRTATGEELEAFVAEAAEDPEVRSYARALLDVAVARMGELDEKISVAAQHWKLNRIAPVDRCVLRIALVELLEMEDVPPKVAINEAIELAKRFSTEASGAFVNGILDRLYREIPKEAAE